MNETTVSTHLNLAQRILLVRVIKRFKEELNITCVNHGLTVEEADRVTDNLLKQANELAANLRTNWESDDDATLAYTALAEMHYDLGRIINWMERLPSSEVVE